MRMFPGYIFPGFDDGGTALSIDINDIAEMRESAWLVYLVVKNYFINAPTNYPYFHIPARGRSSAVFDVFHYFGLLTDDPVAPFFSAPKK